MPRHFVSTRPRLLAAAVAGMLAVGGVGAALAAETATPQSSAVKSTTTTGSGFTKYATTSSSFASKVGWAVKCTPAQVLPDDPIVKPGQPGASHSHRFSGSTATNAYSTAARLVKTVTTSCAMIRDRAAYWMPTLYNNGVQVKPYESRSYYRAGTNSPAAVKPVPFGLNIVAGDAMATTAQSASVAGWQCRDSGGNTVSKQSTIPTCPVGDFLEASVVFPNCWDGVNLDSANHKSHMAYAGATAACPSTHPVRLSQLTFAQRYPVDSTRGAVTLASSINTDSRLTLHADFMNAWDPAAMAYLVNACIKAGLACEDVSERRLPPNTTMPASQFPG